MFIAALEYAENQDCLSLQEAIKHIEMPSSTFYDLADQFEVLERIKKDILNAVLIRINRGSLTGGYNPTAGIWRMKQLGEVEKSETKHDATIHITREIIK